MKLQTNTDSLAIFTFSRSFFLLINCVWILYKVLNKFGVFSWKILRENCASVFFCFVNWVLFVFLVQLCYGCVVDVVWNGGQFSGCFHFDVKLILMNLNLVNYSFRENHLQIIFIDIFCNEISWVIFCLILLATHIHNCMGWSSTSEIANLSWSTLPEPLIVLCMAHANN